MIILPFAQDLSVTISICRLFILYVCVTQRFELFQGEALYKYLLLLLLLMKHVLRFALKIQKHFFSKKERFFFNALFK